MVDMARGFSLVVSNIHFHFVKNCTPVDFNCSDNPIVYFPVGQHPQHCEPYQFRPDQPFEFIFPITKRYCLYHNSLSPIRMQQIVTTETKSINFIRRINDFVSAFAGRFVVSSRRLDESELPTTDYCPRPIVHKYPQPRGTLVLFRYEMGEPLRLPKWKTTFEAS